MAFKIAPNILCFIAALSLFSCHKEEEGIKTPGISLNANTVYVDTFSVEMSTVMIDSVITSSASRLISGSYLDTDLGKITTSSYFQLSLSLVDANADGHEDVIDPNVVNPVYDSLVLVLAYSYSYGDTTQAQKLYVNRVNEYINYVGNTGYLYNSSSFTYDNTPLATVSFKPERNMDASVRVRLDDNLGNEIFALALQENSTLDNNTNFREYFRGLVIRPDPSVHKFIAGFNTTPAMIIYYHEHDDPATAKSYTFKHGADDIHFNQILNDRTGTDLSPLTDSYQEVASAASNNSSYFLSGISLMTKFRIPYLHEIRNIYPNFIISKAYLVISPKYNSYSPAFPLPNSLLLYIADQYNLPTEINAYDNYTSAQYVSPDVDYETQQNTQYKFELTKFIQNEITYPSDTKRSLLLTELSTSSANSAEKIIFPVNNPQGKGAKLILYITVKQ